jgi:hypothetical protein
VVHSVCTSAASVADKHMLPDLLHGEERKVWGDGGYQGQTEAIHEAAPRVQDMTCRRTKFKNYIDEEAKRKNTTKSKVRAKVEHVFRILKRVFGFALINSTCIANAWPYWGCSASGDPSNRLLRPQINLRLHQNPTKSPLLQYGIAVTNKSDPYADAP